jgi:hypothetical protein
MNENEKPLASENRCASDACPRPVEPGEKFCAECGLERSLYFRERRDGRDERARLRENLSRIFPAR